MTDLPRDVAIAVTLAVSWAEMKGERVSPRLIGEAIRLSRYRLVPAEGHEPEEAASPAAEPPQRPKSSVPRVTWPQLCNACNKVKNDRAHAQACEEANCPF